MMVEHPLFSVAQWRTGLSASEWEAVLRADPCAYCRGLGGTIDHIVPLQAVRKGVFGRSSPKANGTGSCACCNVAKAHTPLIFFLHHRNSRAAHDEMTRDARQRERDRRMDTAFFSEEQIELMRKACS
jgi:hypothetical protein